VALVTYLLFVAVVTALVKPVGAYMARVFARERTWLDPVLVPAERLLLGAGRVDPTREMTWSEYARAFIVFSFALELAIYAALRLQSLAPGPSAPYLTTPLTSDLAANTAMSFSTTTTWQAYAGESTMSYASQLALTVGSFLGGASGLAVGVAFVRGLCRDRSQHLGSFWVDLVRATLWVLLPLAIVGGILLVALGVPASFAPYAIAHPLQGGQQVLPQGPVAPLELIKNLGTNGGGYFNVNGAHPYANPSSLTNMVGMLAIVVLPAAFTHTYGKMVGRPAHGWLLFGVMLALFVAGLAATHAAEHADNPLVQAAGGIAAGGGNMEGKELRFGIAQSVLTTVVTSNTATGSYDSMLDSYSPLGGLVPLVNLMLGEIAFGGLGSGIYGLVIVAIIATFISGLMVGRTPVYLGKQIGPPEMKLAALYALAAPIAILLSGAAAVSTEAGRAALTTNGGAHGLTGILVAFSSCFANNGLAFAGMSVNSPFYNVLTMVSMVLGRFALAVPALALAGTFAAQGRRPESEGSLQAGSMLFGGVILGTAVLLVAMSYLPALALGPIVEHFTLHE